MNYEPTGDELNKEIARASSWSFPKPLERRYLLHCARASIRDMGRVLAAVGLLSLLAIALDMSYSRDMFEHLWFWRCAVGGACLIFGAAFAEGRVDDVHRARLLFGSLSLVVMATILYAGSFGGDVVQDRYSRASVILFAVALVTGAIPFTAAIFPAAAVRSFIPCCRSRSAVITRNS